METRLSNRELDDLRELIGRHLPTIWSPLFDLRGYVVSSRWLQLEYPNNHYVVFQSAHGNTIDGYFSWCRPTIERMARSPHLDRIMTEKIPESDLWFRAGAFVGSGLSGTIEAIDVFEANAIDPDWGFDDEFWYDCGVLFRSVIGERLYVFGGPGNQTGISLTFDDATIDDHLKGSRVRLC